MSLTKVQPERRGPQRRSCASVSHDMRLRWRTDRCATVPSQRPPGIHPPAAFHTSALLCGLLRSEARLQDCPAALKGLHGLLVNGWCQKHAFYFQGLCHRLLEEESVRVDTFCGTRRNKSSLWQSTGIWKQASRQFNMLVNSKAILSVSMIENVTHLRQVHPFDGWVVYSTN